MENRAKVELISFRQSDQKNFEIVRQIREKVFVIEQEVDERDEFDEFEGESIHYLMTVDGKAAGTARWRTIGEKTKLERFAIYKEFRNKGYGDLLLQKVIADALEAGNDLYLHAQLKAIPFYARRGFEKVGEQFTECDIEHFKMILKK